VINVISWEESNKNETEMKGNEWRRGRTELTMQIKTTRQRCLLLSHLFAPGNLKNPFDAHAGQVGPLKILSLILNSALCIDIKTTPGIRAINDEIKQKNKSRIVIGSPIHEMLGLFRCFQAIPLSMARFRINKGSNSVDCIRVCSL